MVTGRPSGPVSVFSHGRNALWEHAMASSCGEIRLAVILRTNLPMTPGSVRNSNTLSMRTRRLLPSKSGKPSRVRTVKGKSG